MSLTTDVKNTVERERERKRGFINIINANSKKKREGRRKVYFSLKIT